MPDLQAGSTVRGLDTPPTVADTQNDTYNFDNVSFGVTTTGGTYNDCAAAFTAPTTGRVIVHAAAQLDNSAADGVADVAPVVREGDTVGSGAVVVAATVNSGVRMSGTDTDRKGVSLLVEGLTPGAAYNVRLEHRHAGSGNSTALSRHLIVTPST